MAFSTESNKANKDSIVKLDLPLNAAGGIVAAGYQNYYYKNDLGEVGGFLAITGNLSGNTLAAILPIGFRPEETHLRFVDYWNINATTYYGRVGVNFFPDGRIVVSNKTQAGALIIEQFRFPAAPA